MSQPTTKNNTAKTPVGKLIIFILFVAVLQFIPYLISIYEYHMGLMYYGGVGVPVDYKEAVKWFRKSADNGNVKAMLILAQMYYYGEGVPQDYQEARRWYEEAVKSGDPTAMVSIGAMYNNGLEVEDDKVLAYAYFTLAMREAKKDSNELVYEIAKAKVDSISNSLTKEEIQEAKQIVDSWRNGNLPKRLK